MSHDEEFAQPSAPSGGEEPSALGARVMQQDHTALSNRNVHAHEDDRSYMGDPSGSESGSEPESDKAQPPASIAAALPNFETPPRRSTIAFSGTGISSTANCEQDAELASFTGDLDFDPDNSKHVMEVVEEMQVSSPLLEGQTDATPDADAQMTEVCSGASRYWMLANIEFDRYPRLIICPRSRKRHMDLRFAPVLPLSCC